MKKFFYVLPCILLIYSLQAMNDGAPFSSSTNSASAHDAQVTTFPHIIMTPEALRIRAELSEKYASFVVPRVPLMTTVFHQTMRKKRALTDEEEILLTIEKSLIPQDFRVPMHINESLMPILLALETINNLYIQFLHNSLEFNFQEYTTLSLEYIRMLNPQIPVVDIASMTSEEFKALIQKRIREELSGCNGIMGQYASNHDLNEFELQLFLNLSALNEQFPQDS